MPRGRWWTQEEDAALRDLLARGATASDIAYALDRSCKAVRMRVLALGLSGDRNTFSRWSADLDAVLRQLWATGMSSRCIADKLGFSRRTIANRAADLGLRRRWRKPADVDSLRVNHQRIDDVRKKTIAFELAFCAWAERHGAEIHGYEAAA
jgi:hypothetical protein